MFARVQAVSLLTLECCLVLMVCWEFVNWVVISRFDWTFYVCSLFDLSVGYLALELLFLFVFSVPVIIGSHLVFGRRLSLARYK